MKRIATATALSLSLIAWSSARAAEERINDLSFLIGDWAGRGSGEPGGGLGVFSFKPDLQNHVFVRRAHSEYPATSSRPATIHDDLLVAYDAGSKAIYFDNEGHVIHYGITTDAHARAAVFLSTDPAPAPRFRLTYTQISPDRLKVVFEISPTGVAADFKTYVSGVVQRQTESRQ